MVIDRRSFVARAAGLASGLIAGPNNLVARSAAKRTLAAATVRRRDGSFAAVLYDLADGLVSSVPMPGRGHDIAVNPITRECVAFARRPDAFAVAFGRAPARPRIAFSAPAGRHFYGHGVFSPDGRLLYTTENDFEKARGVIGVWDATANYRRVGEFPAHGIGPHDINLLRDGRTLVVANGGIITHPDHGRRPLNPADMQPALSYVDRLQGDLVERHGLPRELSKLSIRHLDIAANDTVAFGCQFKGPRTEIVSLIGLHRRGQEIALLPADPSVHRALRQYVSSVAVDRDGEFAALTSSRGGAIVFVDIANRTARISPSWPDVSGIAPAGHQGGFIATSGHGDIGLVAPASGQQRALGKTDRAWDNHLVSL